MNTRSIFQVWMNSMMTRSRRKSLQRTPRVAVETLEDRALLSTFVVTSTDDSGPGTLRQAIVDANSTANVGSPDSIEFNISGAGVHTISPLSQLPDITDPVIIDGYSQPGSSPNTNGPGLGDNAVLAIELDGSLAQMIVNDFATGNGLRVTSGNSTIRGLTINRFSGQGIILIEHGGNTVEGNFIGTDPTGTIAAGNQNGGIVMWQYSDSNTIGGLTPASRNVISGNGGVGFNIEFSNGNLIAGNFIGTDVTGTVALTTTVGWAGIFMFASDNNTIGGTTANARNVISGSAGYGVYIYSPYGTGGTKIEGNYIGTDVTGTTAVPNTIGVESWFANSLGGTAEGAGNLISGNTQYGAYILAAGRLRDAGGLAIVGA